MSQHVQVRVESVRQWGVTSNSIGPLEPGFLIMAAVVNTWESFGQLTLSPSSTSGRRSWTPYHRSPVIRRGRRRSNRGGTPISLGQWSLPTASARQAQSQPSSTLPEPPLSHYGNPLALIGTFLGDSSQRTVAGRDASKSR